MRLWRLKSLKQWPQDWKRSVFIPVPKKGNAKECSTTAAAAAKLLQSCPTLCDPIDGSPPGSPVPGILQARTLEWVAVSFSNARKWKVKVKSLSCVRPSATPWTAAFQAPPSMGFSRQEYWSGVPLPSPTSRWDECNCAIVWAFFGIAFLWDWNENWPFPVLWPLLSWPLMLYYSHLYENSITLIPK